MQIRWGSLFFEASGAGWTTNVHTTKNPAGVPYRKAVQIGIEGYWTGTQSELIDKSAIMERGLALPFQDLVLIANDGSIAARLGNAGSTSGTVVTSGPDYLDYRGAEFVTYRSFRFAVEAEYPLTGEAPVIVEYTESIQMSGGGRVRDFIQPVNAKPIRVVLFNDTPYRVTQAGVAVVRAIQPNAYAPINLPLFPNDMLAAPKPTRSTRRIGASEWELKTEWSYEMGSALPLLGLPTPWVN